MFMSPLHGSNLSRTFAKMAICVQLHWYLREFVNYKYGPVRLPHVSQNYVRIF